MNLNDFVVLHNSKAKSVKLNARNLQELQMETVTLSLESKDMEEKLQQLKQSMSKEKEERGHSGRFRWSSGQCGSSNSAKKFKENRLQKLSAGKMRIRMLKNEPLTVQPQPPPLPPTIGPRTIRKNRLTGTICGQCEVKTAGLSCVECTEHYCIGCFARFHQKGALKLHRMIPIQAELQTRVSTRDVVDYYPSTFTSPDPCSKPGTSHTPTSNASTRQDEQSPGREAVTIPMQAHHDTSQVLVVNYTEEKQFESGMKRDDERGFPSSLLRGEYNEVESARSFQEAVRQWRGQTSDGAGEPIRKEAMWIPDRPVSVSATATQADLSPDREAEGQGRGGGPGRVLLRVEFSDNSLTYMDRLLLKKQRRTPIEMYDPLPALDLKPQANTEEESSLTAQEEDFRCYCASLFAVPVSGGETRAQITAPEPCLVIEVLDETEGIMNEVSAEQRTSNKSKDHLFEQVSNKGRTLVPQTAVTGAGSSRVSRSSLSPSRPSSQSKAPTQPTADQRLHPSEPQTSEADHTDKPLPSKSMPPANVTAETPRTSQTSINTSKSQKPNCSTTFHKSEAERGSPPRLTSLPHPQAKIPKSFCSPFSFPPDVFPLATTRSPFPNQNISPSPSTTFMLGSTFTVSPSSSTESTLSAKVCHSSPLQQCSDSDLLKERHQPSTLFQEPISSPKLFQSPPNNLESLEKSMHSLSDPESLLSDNQFQLPQSPRPNPQPRSLEPSQSQALRAPPSATVKAPLSLSLFNESPPDANSRRTSTPTYGDAPVLMSHCSFSGKSSLITSTLSQRDTQCKPTCKPTLSSQSLNVIQNHPFALKLEEEEELSVDSGDEMSSDSLGLAPHNEGSSDEETQMHGRLTRGRSREEEQWNSVTSHLGDSFVPTYADIEKDLQTDEPEHLSEPYMVMHNWSAGSGSEQSYDLERFSPLSVDLSSSLSNTPEHTSCDAQQTRQTPPNDSDPKGTVSCGPSSRLRTNTERQLVCRMMKDSNTQPTGIQICSSTTSRRGEISAYELGTSASKSSTPTLSHPTTTTPSPPRPPVFPSSSQSPSPPRPACRFRPTSASEWGPVVRPLSQAAQEIMDICRLDQTGCEDPDLDTDTTAHTLHGLEQDLKETGTQASLFAAVNSGRQSQHENHRLTRDRVSDAQREVEEAAKRDRQSVLLLP